MADLLIATKAFCNTLKAGSFTRDTTMCPTRSQIESAGLYIKKVIPIWPTSLFTRTI